MNRTLITFISVPFVFLSGDTAEAGGSKDMGFVQWKKGISNSIFAVSDAKRATGYNGLTETQKLDIIDVLEGVAKETKIVLNFTLDVSRETMFNLRDIAVAGVEAGSIKLTEEAAEASLEYGAELISPGMGAGFEALDEARELAEPVQLILDKDYWELAEWTAKQTFIVPIKTIGALKVGAVGCTAGGVQGCVTGANVGWDAGGVVAAGVEGAVDELGDQIGSAIAGE